MFSREFIALHNVDFDREKGKVREIEGKERREGRRIGKQLVIDSLIKPVGL